MEVNGEISDTDSGIILHSGSDSPTTHTKDVTTHTRAMKLKHQALQDRLELCILELKKLCIREAELTGRLSDDYPLLPGEKRPKIRRRIGAAFKLDAQSIPRGTEKSELILVDAELALQMKIYEAARKLFDEDHLSKAVKKSRSQQCKREEKKLKRLQDTSFQLRLKHGRSSPLPAFNISQQDLGTSDDSSLSDSVVQDEEVTSQSSQPSSGFPYPAETDPPQPPTVPSQFCVDGPCASPSLDQQSQLLLTPNQSPHPSFDSSLSFNSSPVYDAPPIQHSPWTESSLDQPYQKSRKSRSSIKTSSPAKSELLPPLEACLAHSALPLQLSHLKLSRAQSSSVPSTPEMRVHRQLSLRLSNESSFEKDRGRTRGPRRRLTDYAVTFPETPLSAVAYGSHASSEDSNSEHSFTSYNSSPHQEVPCDLPKHYQSAFPGSSGVGSFGPQSFSRTAFYNNSRHQPSPIIHKSYYNEMVYSPDTDMARSYYAPQTSCPSNRYEVWYKDSPPQPHQRQQRPLPPDIRLSPSPAQWNHPHYSPSGVPRQVVNEQLNSWHRRSQQKSPKSRSLDRQGAVRVKNMQVQESPCYQSQRYHEQMIQRRAPQRGADGTQGHWVVDDGSHFISQV
ncbi:innate immunity activator b isoform X1 [Hippoglossus hippoglossus]|uniref:innate immunity activator b isoform X1 n=1 Tax=Hippoglossus hippoglossus TaxID=8267 RepID=UPI00148CF755|nr:innate immunity activator b isoform X1 [Hippoglossus hippoglossus]XP_034442075.1 innate immunity activator b isoform X1 [Hippoglossus hippoglossus]